MYCCAIYELQFQEGSWTSFLPEVLSLPRIKRYDPNGAVEAEGVETREQVNFLHKNKCDVMQGFYFCRPVPAEVATHVLEEILSEGKSEESQCSATN